MKKILFTVLLMTFINCKAQNIGIQVDGKGRFIGQDEDAFQKRRDSLRKNQVALEKNLSQNTFHSNFDGVWTLKSIIKFDESNSDLEFSEYVKFINNDIYFFKVESGIEKLVSVIEVKFEKNYTTSTQIKLENGEIWELNFRSINNEIRLIWQLNMTKDGGFIIQTRCPAKDPVMRKKALEYEINTYYVKVK